MLSLNSVRLYLPDAALKDRIGNDAGPLSAYIKSLQQRLIEVVGATKPEGVDGLLISVGAKPNGASRVWCDPVGGNIPKEMLDKIEAELSKIPGPAVKNGPIAFALEIQFKGRPIATFPTIPKRWSDAAKTGGTPLMLPDGVFKVIWPD